MRGLALSTLEQYGPLARPAIPALLALAAQEGGHWFAGSALRAIVKGVPATPILDAMESDQPMVAETAAALLELVELDARRDVPRLAGLLGRSEDEVVHAALDALRRLGPEAAEAVPALLRLIRRRQFLVGDAAIEALGRIGPPALPALMEVLGTADSLGRDSVFAQLAEGRWEPGPTAAALAPLLSEKRYSDSSGLAEALAHQGEPAVRHLVAALGKSEADVPRVVFDALGRLGPAARDAVPALLALAERDPLKCDAVADALDYILADEADSTVRNELDQHCSRDTEE